MRQLLLTAGLVLLAAEGWSASEMAKGLKFSTYGNDCWLDGAETNAVPAGECYALVWKQNGAVFAGLPTEPPNPNDPYALGEEVWLVDYFPVASLDEETGRMRCPEQIIGVGKLPAWEAKNGTWTVYLLDTRYHRADGSLAYGFDKAVTNAPRRINAYRAIPGLADFTIGTTLGPTWEIMVGGSSDGWPVVADVATEAKQGVVTFDAQGGTCGEVSRSRVYGDDYGELPTVTRTGYAFVGWFTAAEGGAQVFATSPTDGERTLFAHWDGNRYSVRFDPAGGCGEMTATEFKYGVPGFLPPCAFKRTDCDFVGWAVEPGGPAVFGNEGEVLNLTDVADGLVGLRAVWMFHEGTVCEMLTDGTWSIGTTAGTGTAEREGDVTHAEQFTAHLSADGPDVVWIETAVTNAARLTFEWKVSGSLALMIDGVTVRTLEGQTGWTGDVDVEIAGSGSHVLRWSYWSDEGGDAWVSNVRVHPGVHVTFDGNGAASWTVPSSFLVYEGDRFFLPEQGEMRRRGCEFLGWEVGEEILPPGTELTARDKDVLCTALWTKGEILPELSWYDPDEAVWEILSVAEDDRLRSNVTDVWTYGRFREWALGVLTTDGTTLAGAESVLSSPCAWVSFALDSDRLLERAPVDEDLMIERFEPIEGFESRFGFTVRVEGVTVGPWAWVDDLSRVFGVEGSNVPCRDAFSSDEVTIEFDAPEEGKLKFSAGPSWPFESKFFMRPLVIRQEM